SHEAPGAAQIRRDKSKRVRTVRTHHEKKLKKKFVCVREVSRLRQREVSESVLSTDLTELAGPISKNARKARIDEVGVSRAAAPVKAPANSPTSIHAIFR